MIFLILRLLLIVELRISNLDQQVKDPPLTVCNSGNLEILVTAFDLTFSFLADQAQLLESLYFDLHLTLRWRSDYFYKILKIGGLLLPWKFHAFTTRGFSEFSYTSNLQLYISEIAISSKFPAHVPS